MFVRWVVPVIAVVVAACAGPSPDPTGAGWQPRGTLVVGSFERIVSIDPISGSILADAAGVPALGGWSTFFAASPIGGDTLLRARDAVTGETTSTVRLPGEWSVRVAAWDGSRVALMAPLGGRDPWTPEPRAATTILVADPTGAQEARPFHLRGNFEPEAFSTDGRHLYLIRFVPPTDPRGYQVARLSLDDGRVSPVNTGTKGVVETMSGTRLDQVASPDGTMLYTLYTTAPASYAHGAAHGDAAAFIHTLSLDEGWAHCFGLPKELWGGDPAHQAMALSPDGESLYVVDTDRRLAAAMDTRELDVAPPVPVNLGEMSAAEAHAVVTGDGRLVVAAGDRVVALSIASFRPVASWTPPAPVTGLGWDAHGLYVASPAGVEILDPGSGDRVGTVRSPVVRDVAYIGVLGA